MINTKEGKYKISFEEGGTVWKSFTDDFIDTHRNLVVSTIY